MRKLIALTGFLLFLALPRLHAQTKAPNAAGVSFGQWYTRVQDVEKTKQFWVRLGGKPIKIDGVDAIKFQGGFVFLVPGNSSGSSRGSTVGHVGLGSQNVQNLFAKLKADGVPYDEKLLRPSPLNGQYLGDVDTPDGLMLEITQEAGVAPYPKLPPDVPIEINHMHLFVAADARKTMQAWYVKVFGGEPSEMRNEIIVSIPGMQFFRILPCGSEMSACPATGALPTKGRALDHIGFEIKDLKAFCKKLEATGVKLDAPYSKTRHKSFASAGLTDPWGVSIELTEGLNRF